MVKKHIQTKFTSTQSRCRVIHIIHSLKSSVGRREPSFHFCPELSQSSVSHLKKTQRQNIKVNTRIINHEQKVWLVNLILEGNTSYLYHKVHSGSFSTPHVLPSISYLRAAKHPQPSSIALAASISAGLKLSEARPRTV